MAKDNINPSHYKLKGIEVIDIMEEVLSPEQFDGYLKGNIIKYTLRESNKNGTEDMEKAQWYLNRLVETRRARGNESGVEEKCNESSS